MPSIKSRGIPSAEDFWLPRHDSVKDILGISGDPFDEFGADWGIEGVFQFVFPKKYKETYHNNSVAFMKVLLSKGEMRAAEIGEWVRTNNVSKATFYNKIIPRLKRVGMLSAERETPAKGAGYILKPSLTFHNYLYKMAREWQRIVKTARSKPSKG